MKLELIDIRKKYKGSNSNALEDVSLTFEPGIYALLGPNGAGKTTMLNIITDNIAPDDGEVLCDGSDIKKLGQEYRNMIGYMPQQQSLFDDFTGNTFMWYMAALKGLHKKEAKKRIEELIYMVNLSKERYKKIKSYSGGMKQRLLIAQALLNDPAILLLDEPTAGLDPEERIRFRTFIKKMSKEKVIIISTHVVSDIEYIADKIMILNHGHILYCGSESELLAKIPENANNEVDDPLERAYLYISKS